MWIFLRRRFSGFLGNLNITDIQHEDGQTKRRGICSALNRAYWGHNSETDNHLLVGSWGKMTRVAPPRDIDLMFFLPGDVYNRFQQRSGNIQSQLLQEVRDVLSDTYSTTARIRGDGQVVVLPFNSISVEVVPAFRLQNGHVFICDTNDGGRYKTVAPEAEIGNLHFSDVTWNGNTRALVRMMKSWRKECNVPIKSFQLELLAIDFLNQWSYSKNDLFWYDWMVRDFLAYLISRANTYVFFPETAEMSFLGDEWLSRAQAAYSNAVQACEYERDNFDSLAGQYWQKIFGYDVPGSVI
jgi:hypothetical protein